jgi:hypothetical protein
MPAPTALGAGKDAKDFNQIPQPQLGLGFSVAKAHGQLFHF